jgi:excinuclease UvrABC ATPase subunit
MGKQKPKRTPTLYARIKDELMIEFCNIVKRHDSWLFSAVGQPHDPQTGRPLNRETSQQIVDQILGYGVGTRIVLPAAASIRCTLSPKVLRFARRSFFNTALFY